MNKSDQPTAPLEAGTGGLSPGQERIPRDAPGDRDPADDPLQDPHDPDDERFRDLSTDKVGEAFLPEFRLPPPTGRESWGWEEVNRTSQDWAQGVVDAYAHLVNSNTLSLEAATILMVAVLQAGHPARFNPPLSETALLQRLAELTSGQSTPDPVKLIEAELAAVLERQVARTRRHYA